MNDQLLSIAVGFALGAVAKEIVKAWTRNAPAIQEALDKADDRLEAHFGIDIPDSMQATWHRVVHGAVAYVNRFASDGRFWREVIRAIIAKDPSKAVLLQQELAGLSWEKGIAAVEAVMSPDLKVIVNEVKEQLAVKIATANGVTTDAIPDSALKDNPDKIEAEVRAAVRVVAPAHKTEEGPVTKSRIEQMIIESQERQAKLGGQK